MPPPILHFTDPLGEFDPSLTCRQFAETPLGRQAAMKLDGMRTQFLLDRCASAGRRFNVTIRYQGQALAAVELFLLLPNEKVGWENWSEDSERRRKEEGERWLAETFGQPAAILPFEVDGQWITPFEQKWDSLRGIRFPWGEVTSFFDGKGGFAGLLIRYQRPD